MAKTPKESARPIVAKEESKQSIDKPKNLSGRPTKYTPELAMLVCERVATDTDGLAKICEKNADLPERSTVYLWLLKHPEFSDAYAQAKRKQADLMAESINELAREQSFYYDADGNKRIDPGFIASQRLQIDTRKWIATKLIPKIYGDKIQHEGSITLHHEAALKELE